jgi:hypothetical protein
MKMPVFKIQQEVLTKKEKTEEHSKGNNCVVVLFYCFMEVEFKITMYSKIKIQIK